MNEMAEAKAKTTLSQFIFNCSACGQDVVGTLSVSLELGTVGPEGRVDVNGKLTGLRISHDCIPKVTRGSNSERDEDWCGR
jgi:hypothetical protein